MMTKFRAWVKTDEGYEMVYDYCYLDETNNHFYGTDLENERPDILEVLEIMQFINKQDCNNNDIYVGDRIEYTYDEIVNYDMVQDSTIYETITIKGIIVFAVNESEYVMKVGDKFYHLEYADKIEVTGNIYENDFSELKEK